MSENKEDVAVEEVKEDVAVEEVKEELPTTATLHSLIINLQTIIDQARTIIIKYQYRSNDIDIREKNVLAREITVRDKETNINGREAECQKVENIQKLHADAKSSYDASNLRINAAVEAERKLRLCLDEENSKLDQKRQLCAQEAKNLEKRAKQIEEEVSKRVTKALSDMGFNKPQLEDKV